ncbi:Acyl-CoA synthetase (AMP-forming)/AMP-acid ligase II [Neorhodopirellula lusitana]|uniref:Acyl-CoA synthetase (AMP-forming)/AMP-acid ligase II n=1 Tax=Neorhodopirellula lusitana TaxID=445327 RepID=A0ABY1PP32_9BACT|nr:fatty acid CoA ligase family protein [Neorhodopirellula lusitana]SMP38060.1 Acyl-CoA synthetase (AMP-forming)/AMP-acid ligase II [Neorhodopirellula lusitana]
MTATDPNHSCSDSVLASPSSGNVADRLTSMAKMLPGAIAIAEVAGPPKLDGTDRDYSLTTFKALDEGSTKIARGLTAWGVRPGMRLVSLVPFGGQFIELVFALMKSGVTVVLIDPGMDRKHLVNCISEIRPDGFVGIPKAQAIRTLLRHRFPQAKWNVTVGKRWFWGGKTLSQIVELGEQSACELPKVETDHEAAVIFTTGSTGPPKGVSYTHGTFHAQIDRIQARYDIRKGSRDLACFPLFGLFDAVMGVTTIIPDMDPTRPAAVDPRKLIQAARQWEVDQAFGSPALWRTVTKWCEENAVGCPFPTLRRVLSAGAPVPAATLASLRRFVHEEAVIETPYGATEALPIASIESRQVISETGPASTKGKGVCVGTRFDGVDWKVIAITDGPIRQIADVEELPQGKIGELMVSGPMVTRRYVTRLDQNDIHKVADGERVWHRMGDVGYFDAQDRFWFCGRKTHRVTGADRTYFTIPCEAVFNVHPRVEKCALVGRGDPGNQVPVMVIEPSDMNLVQDERQREVLIDELRDLASRNPLTRRIQEFQIQAQPLPVDIRHNSKIFREKLSAEVQDSR